MRDLEFDIRGRDKTAAAFDAARANARRFNGDLDMTARGLNMAATAGKAFMAGISLAALADVGRAMQAAVQEAADLVDLANKVGVDTTSLQQMVFGFSQAGVSADVVEKSLVQWSKRIGEAHTQGGLLADILRANNVPLTDQNGKLRTSVDLMRDMANLIRGAGSDQERITLAMEAFGRGGADMVLALQEGADGFDAIMREAAKAGGVLDDEVLQRAAEIDDRFNAITRTIEISMQSALIRGADTIDLMVQRAGELESVLSRVSGFQFSGFMEGLVGGVFGMPGAAGGPAQRAIDAIGDGFVGADGKGSRTGRNPLGDLAFHNRWSKRPEQQTIIPERGGGDRAAKAQVSAYDQVIAKLEQERRLLGLNATEQRILTEQRRAGVDATSKQGLAIEAHIRFIDAESERLDRMEEQQRAYHDAIDHLTSSAIDGLTAWAEGASSAEDAMKSLGLELLKAAAYGALLGEGPLAGLFGGGGLFGMGGGGFKANTTFTSFLGYRANGGPVDPWGTYVIGERGPELLKMGGRGGHVVANGDAFGGASAGAAGSMTVRLLLPKGFRSEIVEAARADTIRIVEDYDHALPDRVQAIQHHPNLR